MCSAHAERPAGAEAGALRVLVVLPRHLDVDDWAKRFAQGDVPDATPYGYHHASRCGCSVSFARATPTWPGPLGWFDRGLKKLLGFDLRHVWANRALLRSGAFDCVWTHTEHEHLAIGLLRRLSGVRFAPVIAQSIWLLDEWPRWSALRRRLVTLLMQDAEVASVHSPLNAARAVALGLGRSVAVVDFGISLQSFPLAAPRRHSAPAQERPVRVLALGNDRHRDWETLAQALGGRAEYEVRIGSNHYPAHLQHGNIEARAMTQHEVLAHYAWADCFVVPLHANLHASGLTTLLEAVASGVPVVVTRAGGLEHYFDDACVGYCAPGDAADLRRTLGRLMSQPGLREQRAAAAQQRLLARRLTSEGFAARHAELTQRLNSHPAQALATGFAHGG